MQFTRKTSSSKTITSLVIKLSFVIVIILGAVFLLSKVDFPAPKKEIEKIIPNENFKIVK
jgi:flagellar biogenesis protein FliO